MPSPCHWTRPEELKSLGNLTGRGAWELPRPFHGPLFHCSHLFNGRHGARCPAWELSHTWACWSSHAQYGIGLFSGCASQRGPRSWAPVRPQGADAGALPRRGRWEAPASSTSVRCPTAGASWRPGRCSHSMGYWGASAAAATAHDKGFRVAHASITRGRAEATDAERSESQLRSTATKPCVSCSSRMPRRQLTIQ